MNKISYGQFASLLLITDAFALLCLYGNISVLTTAGFLTGIIIQTIMAIPVIKFYNSGGALKNCRKVVCWFYLIYLLLWGGILFSMLWNAAEIIYIPFENIGFVSEKLLISGLIAVSCLYVSSPGIKAMSRAGTIVAVLGVLCLLIFLVSAVPNAKFEYLTDLWNSNGFFDEFIRGFSISGSLGSFVVLLEFVNGSKTKSSIMYFSGKAILYTVVTIAATSVAGGIMTITNFPIVSAAELSQPFSVQRIDSLFLMIFVILAVFSIAVQVIAASYLFRLIFTSFSILRSTCSLVLMIGAAFALSKVGIYHWAYAIAVMVALLIVPTAMLIKKSRGRG